MHYIQKKIFDKLLLAKSLRYSELRPPKIESNNFAYHLKEIVRDGLVQKNRDGQYELSAQGLAYADRITHQTLDVRIQPKIITLLDVTNDEGETLLFRRHRQPYLGLVTHPAGKVHFGESTGAAAKRELEEKAGIKNVRLEHCGDVYLSIFIGDTQISHALAHVFHGHAKKRLPVQKPSFWGVPKEVATERGFVPGFEEIKAFIAEPRSFYAEYTFRLDT